MQRLLCGSEGRFLKLEKVYLEHFYYKSSVTHFFVCGFWSLTRTECLLAICLTYQPYESQLNGSIMLNHCGSPTLKIQ